MLFAYIRWTSCQCFLQRAPLLHAGAGFEVGNFPTFTQFWHRKEPISSRDLSLLAKCKQLSAPNSIAVDVGANLGIYSLALAAVGYPIVFAIEPAPDTFARLRKNLKQNPRLCAKIVTNCKAVGTYNGPIEFRVCADSPEQSRIKISEKDSLRCAEVITVDSVTLDHLFASGDLEIGFLKIDVEGFEYQALTGARELLLQKRVRFVWLELIDLALHENGSSSQEVNGVLKSYGFRPCVLDNDSSDLRPCTLEHALATSGTERSVLFARDR